MPGYGDVNAWKFLEELYAVPGVQDDFDAASLHPYAPDFQHLQGEIERVRKVMNEHGDQATPLWITEIGWGSAPPDRFGINQGLQGQNTMLKKSFGLILSHQKDWNVGRLFWFDWRDPSKSGVVSAASAPAPDCFVTTAPRSPLTTRSRSIQAVPEAPSAPWKSVEMLYAARKMGDTEARASKTGSGGPLAALSGQIGQAGASSEPVPAAAAWSWNYEPEPTAMGPSRPGGPRRCLARGTSGRGGDRASPLSGAALGSPLRPLPRDAKRHPGAAASAGDRPQDDGCRITEEATYASARRRWRPPFRRRPTPRSQSPPPCLACFRSFERQATAFSLGPVARGHPARRGRDHRTDARGARAAHGPAASSGSSTAPPTGSS